MGCEWTEETILTILMVQVECCVRPRSTILWHFWEFILLKLIRVFGKFFLRIFGANCLILNPSFAGWIQNMDARPQKFINYNRCIIGTVTTICYNSTKKKWIQTDKNFIPRIHFLISQKYRGVHQWECPRVLHYIYVLVLHVVWP